MHKVFRVVSSLLAFCALTLASWSSLTGPASAQPHVRVLRSTMTVTSIDVGVARAHGFVVRRASTGKLSVYRAGTATPLNTVGGNCGSSYVYLTDWDRSGRGYYVETGFTVKHNAVSYAWAVDVYGPSGWRKTWGGAIALRPTWRSGRVYHGVSSSGTYEGLVTSPSYAVLWTGEVCTSGHPYDYEYVS